MRGVEEVSKVECIRGMGLVHGLIVEVVNRYGYVVGWVEGRRIDIALLEDFSFCE